MDTGDDSNNGSGESNDYNGNLNDKSVGGCNDDIFGSCTLYLGQALLVGLFLKYCFGVQKYLLIRAAHAMAVEKKYCSN